MKFKTGILLSAFCVVMLSFSCKKKETINEQPSNQGSYYHPDKVNGVLAVYKTLYFDSGILDTNSYAVQAFFSDSLSGDFIGIASADYGNIKLNSTFLKKQYSPNQVNSCFYYDTTAAKYEGYGDWIIDGNVPSHGFTANVKIEYPNYTGWKNISDTLDLNRNFYLDFNELNGIYDAAITISTNSNGLTKPLGLNSHSITFTSTELKSIFIGGGDVGRITIEITKSDYKIIKGLIIDFKAVLVLQKNNFIIKL